MSAIVNVTEVSGQVLASLKAGPTINLYHRGFSEAAPELLMTGVHRKMLCGFSNFLQERLPNSGVSNEYTITVGTHENCTIILRWMINCCDGNGAKTFAPNSSFGDLVDYIKLAIDLNIPSLIGLLNKRIRREIEKGLYANDVRAAYRRLKPNDPYRKRIVEVLAKVALRGDLKGQQYYEVLKNEVPEYQVELNAEIERLKQTGEATPLLAEREQKLKERHEKNEMEKAERLAREAEARRQRTHVGPAVRSGVGTIEMVTGADGVRRPYSSAVGAILYDGRRRSRDSGPQGTTARRTSEAGVSVRSEAEEIKPRVSKEEDRRRRPVMVLDLTEETARLSIDGVPSPIAGVPPGGKKKDET